MLNIFEYKNYRNYLRDFYETRKDQNAKFSYRVFSRMLGFTSPNFLKLIILGDRNLTETSLQKVISGLKLEGLAQKYLKSLVLCNQCKDEEEKKNHQEKIDYIRALATEKNLDDKYCDYLSNWYYPVIREMTLLKSFREDPEWIANKLNDEVSPLNITQAIDDMIKLGLLKRDDHKQLIPVDATISTDPEAVNLSLKKTHKKFIEKAKDSIDNTPPHFRDISSLTVAVNQDMLAQTKKIIRKFRQDLNILLSKSSDMDTVYQINFQVFNVTNIPWPAKN